MTVDEIRAAIQASPALQRLRAAGNVVALTAMLRLTGERAEPGEVLSMRAAAARFPAADGLPGPLALEVVLVALETYATANASSAVLARRLRARAINRLLDALQAKGLDFGEPGLRASLELLGQDVLTPAQVEGLKALARRQPAQLTERQVREAMGTVLPTPPAP